MKYIIGVNGLARHGKDTVSQMLEELLPYRTKQARYATPLKFISAYVFGLSQHDLESTEGKNRVVEGGYGLTSRQIQQKVGTESFRDVFDDNIWLDFMDRNIDTSVSVYIKPDVRFRNEIDHTHQQAKKFGCRGFNIQVIDPRRVTEEQDRAIIAQFLDGNLVEGVQIGGHRSEVLWPKTLFDYTIVNDGSLLDLENKVRQMIVDLGLVK